jgi:hypothetical protein
MYDEICEHFSVDKYGMIDNLGGFLELMIPSLLIYCHIYNPFLEFAFDDAGDMKEPLRIASIRLHRLGIIDVFMPLFLSAYNRYDYKTLLKIMGWAEIYVMRVFRIAEKKSNTGRNEFLKTAGKLYWNEMTISHVKDIFINFCNKHCPVKRIKIFFERKGYDFYEWKYTKYLLIEYDVFLQCSNNNNEVVMIEPSDVSMEHILPREFENTIYWVEQFGLKSVCSKCINRLGNLTLSKKAWNSSYGSKSFPDKKMSTPYGYMSSSYKIEKELCDYEHWNKENIDERQKKIASWASTRWAM